ncbi:hypothetical protein CPB84DRAFT_1752198 [Gymnopilus junonius]|uniref:Uncharacterized protein n=1 Tax=Gymnopilus junonius TaxID=109634 RepID=A0A9P5NBN1_GYMJU|nr:hypothetical protein CPB84DRAFT_1752198 [Gymnopilus junonius]
MHPELQDSKHNKVHWFYLPVSIVGIIAAPVEFSKDRPGPNYSTGIVATVNTGNENGSASLASGTRVSGTGVGTGSNNIGGGSNLNIGGTGSIITGGNSSPLPGFGVN